MRRRLLASAALLAIGVALGACGGSAAGSADGTAEIWVTRDRGSEVVLTATVPAGLTVLQALEREADVETRYGGRFVQAIEGIEGSLAAQRDWFFLLNGIEPDVGAAEVTLRPGDIAWWDFRSWTASAEEQRVAVGAFPEPFLHGWEGIRRPAEVRAPAGLAAEAQALEALLGGGDAHGEPNVFVLAVREGAEGATLAAARGSGNGSPVTFTLSGSLDAVRAVARAIAEDPAIVRFRYEARFDEAGRVVG